MTCQMLEEYLLRQKYSLLCEILFLPANIVQALLWYEASFTFQIKGKNICLTHCNQVQQVSFIHFLTISKNRQR